MDYNSEDYHIAKEKEIQFINEIENRERKRIPRLYKVSWVRKFKYLPGGAWTETYVVVGSKSSITEVNNALLREMKKVGLELDEITDIRLVDNCIVDLETHLPSSFGELDNYWGKKWYNEEERKEEQ